MRVPLTDPRWQFLVLGAALCVASCGDEMQTAPAADEHPGDRASSDAQPRLGSADMVGETSMPADDEPSERPGDDEAEVPVETCELGVLEVRGPLALDTWWKHCEVVVLEDLTVPLGGA